MKAFLFAGPTLFRAMQIGAPRSDDLVILRPIRRGDLPRLASTHSPGVAIIVDGNFHLDALAVGHAEIRDAIAAGWQVWGVSSMGAIRAAEMESFGMRGSGRCFEAYRDDPSLRDDEVALLHEPTPPYREGSEPLLHLRLALADMARRNVIANDVHDRVIEQLYRAWFGRRTIAWTRTLLVEAGADADAVAAELRDLDRFRQKAHDLIDFLARAPFRTATAP